MDVASTAKSRSKFTLLLRAAGRSALELIYPSQCRICSKLMRSRDGLCPNCWRQVQFIERPYCEILGIPFATDRGEGAVSALAMAQPPPFDKLRSVILHEGLGKALAQQLKYADRGDLAPMMAAWMKRASDGMLDECDYIVAVPLHRRRLLYRRFNQSAELARHLASMTGRSFLAGALIRRKATRQQVGLSARARQENVRAAFSIATGFEEKLAGKRILLIDDVYTTGATVSSVARVLKRAGAEKVLVLTFAMAISQPI